MAGSWPDTPLARVEVVAIVQALNSSLLSHPSATVTLENWCRDHRLAPDAHIVACRLYGPDKPISTEQRSDLTIGPDDVVKYRRVELVCGTRVLSVADNWYVPARLSPGMNEMLQTTDMPFGRVVASLRFTRRTLEAQILWSALPAGWEMDPLPPAGDVPLKIPDALLRHRAVLSRADGTPFSEVEEIYTGQLLDFAPPR